MQQCLQSWLSQHPGLLATALAVLGTGVGWAVYARGAGHRTG
jgi:hypothetical protein